MITSTYLELKLLLGKYRLIRLLGESGSSEVYLGEHLDLHMPVAIKVLRRHFTRNELQKFLEHAYTLTQLVHPHIVRVFDFGVEHSRPLLVMNYAPRGTLRQRHPRGSRVPLETVAAYVKQIAGALQYVHDLQLIHRDVKPHNMLLGAYDEVLLSDFGVAVTSQSMDASFPGTPDFEGTALYAAPEQLQGKPRRSSDQYALGVVVYEWLSGEWPFSGSFYEVARQHIHEPPPSLRERGIDIAPAVEEAVLKALAKDPRQRFDSVWEFAEALQWAGHFTSTIGVQPKPKRQFRPPLPFAMEASNAF